MWLLPHLGQMQRAITKNIPSQRQLPPFRTICPRSVLPTFSESCTQQHVDLTASKTRMMPDILLNIRVGVIANNCWLAITGPAVMSLPEV